MWRSLLRLDDGGADYANRYPFVRYLLPAYSVTPQKRLGRQGVNTYLFIVSLIPPFQSTVQTKEESSMTKEEEEVMMWKIINFPLLISSSPILLSVRTKCCSVVHNLWCPHRVWKWTHMSQQPMKSENLYTFLQAGDLQQGETFLSFLLVRNSSSSCAFFASNSQYHTCPARGLGVEVEMF